MRETESEERILLSRQPLGQACSCGWQSGLASGMLRRTDALLRRAERRVVLDASLIRPPTRVPRMKALLKVRRLRRLS